LAMETVNLVLNFVRSLVVPALLRP